VSEIIIQLHSTIFHLTNRNAPFILKMALIESFYQILSELEYIDNY